MCAWGVQIHSRKVFTWVNLKGVSSQGGDFVTSRLSPVINSRSRNRLVLAAYLDYCTECDGAASTAAVSPATQVGEVGVLTEAQQLLMRKQHVRGSSSSSGGSRSDSDEDSDEEGPELSIAGRRAMRKALGFAVDIEHANALNELFINAGGLGMHRTLLAKLVWLCVGSQSLGLPEHELHSSVLQTPSCRCTQQDVLCASAVASYGWPQ